MATLNIKAIAVCGNGDHITIRPSLDGNDKPSLMMHVVDITSAVSDEDIAVTMRVLLKLYSIGRTKGQVKAGLNTGIDVVIP